jgi:hypothetical protein
MKQFPELNPELAAALARHQERDQVVLYVPGYESLADVLRRAFNQAACGKGKERHAADGLAFDDQPMNAINDVIGSYDGHIYQACKKAVESKRLPPERAVAELLGAINYMAGAVLHIEKRSQVNHAK